MPILDRLVIAPFVRIFTICLAVTPVIFIVGDVAGELDTYVDRGLSAWEVSLAYLYQIPLFVQWAFPIAALLATVFTVHGMTVHRELVAAKSGGVSFHRCLLPLVGTGVLLVVAGLALAEIVPRTNKHAGRILRAQTFTSQFRADFAFRSESGLSWQIGRLSSLDGALFSVVAARPAMGRGSGLHMAADQATWQDGEGWTFDNGYLRLMHPDSTESAFQFEALRMARASDSPDQLMETPLEAEEMTRDELSRAAEMLERTGGDPTEMLVHRERNVTLAFATLVVLLFGAPLATNNKRGGAAFGIGLSLVTVVLYLLCFRFAGSLGLAGAISPVTAAWGPNVLFLMAGLALLLKVRT